MIGEPVSDGGSCVHASIAGYVEEIFHFQKAPGVLEACVKIRKETEKTGNGVPLPWNLKNKAFKKRCIGLA